jgi:hypothetical protein
MAQAETKVPRCARNDESMGDKTMGDKLSRQTSTAKKREPADWMMPGGRIPTAGSQGMTLTQGAYMLLTFCPT